MSGWTAAGVLTRCLGIRHANTTTDLVVELDRASRVIELLDARGYSLVTGAPPKSFVMVDARGCQVDIHPVAFNAEGGGVYQMEDGTEWVYPSEGFTGRGSVDDGRVRCLSPEVQVLVHAGYELTQKDYRELYLLRERFGVEPRSWQSAVRDTVALTLRNSLARAQA